MTKTQHPLPEYPRPALRRDSFESLNGLWQFAITKSAQLPRQWEGDILVPYSPETRASGVGRTLQPGEWLHYHRSFAPPAGSGGRVLLHFGAVDYACAVQVNGHLVGGHRGGYWPFTFDITEALNAEHNRLWVAVQDPTGAGVQARGKQTLRPGGMFYPAQSGIWQTVWLERVPDNYIETLTVTPDYDARTVTVRARTAKPGGAVNLWAVVRAGGVTIAEDWGSDEADRDGAVTLNIPEEHFFPWSPDSPFLYDLTVGTTQGEEESFDTVHSYFALRKWSCAPDAKGVLRFCLNDRPLLLNGLLDQGYWPEGLYTPPSDAAVVHELQTIKELGFNLLRKHAKIEPQRWYYHCDKLGLIVWQDMVNGGSAYTQGGGGPRPPATPRRPAGVWGAAAARPAGKNTAGSWKQRWRPCGGIPASAAGCPSTRGGGSSMPRRQSKRSAPSTPTVWWTRPAGGMTRAAAMWTPATTISIRSISGPAAAPLPSANMAAWPMPGHEPPRRTYGYGTAKSRAELTGRYRKLQLETVLPQLRNGLSALVYTQVSDVEDEVNGLFTYDRQEIKPDPAAVRAVNEALEAEFEKVLKQA